jgi:hypothetical protein
MHSTRYSAWAEGTTAPPLAGHVLFLSLFLSPLTMPADRTTPAGRRTLYSAAELKNVRKDDMAKHHGALISDIADMESALRRSQGL